MQVEIAGREGGTALDVVKKWKSVVLFEDAGCLCHARFRELLTQQSLVSDFETQGQCKDGVTRDLLVTVILCHREADTTF